MICPVCDSENIFLYLEDIFDCDKTKVMECKNCGLQFLNPMMSQEEEEQYYNDYYNSQKERHYKELKLKDIQENSFSHYESYHKIYNNLLKNKSKILEVGCGVGGFLKFILKNIEKADITAIERSETNFEFLKSDDNRDFTNITFLKNLSEVKNCSFDLIVAFGVLEHIKDYQAFLSSLSDLLTDENSIMVFNVPNKAHPLIEIFNLNEFKKFTYMKQHYYTFSEKSFRLIAKKIGCKVVKFRYIQVWGLDNTLSWLRYRYPTDFSRISKFLSKKTLDSYNKDLIKHKTTDLMMVILKKS